MKKKSKAKFVLKPGAVSFSEKEKGRQWQPRTQRYISGGQMYAAFYIVRLMLIAVAGYGFAVMLPESFEVVYDRKTICMAVVAGASVFGGLCYYVRKRWLKFTGTAALWCFAGIKYYKEIYQGFGLLMKTAVTEMAKMFDVHVPLWAENMAYAGGALTVFTAFCALVFVCAVIFEAGHGGGSAVGLILFILSVAAVLVTGVTPAPVPVFLFVLSYLVLALCSKTGGTDERREMAWSGLRMMVCGGAFLLALTGAAFGLVPEKMHISTEKSEEVKKEVQGKFEQIGSLLSGKSEGFKLNSVFSSDGISKGRLDKAGNLSYSGKEMLGLQSDRIVEGTVYLKGFVSGSFKNHRWYPLDEDLFLDMAGSREEAVRLWNMQSEILAESGSSADLMITDQYTSGDYSPYGAVVGTQMQIHGDGWLGSDGGQFSYYPAIYEKSGDYTRYEGVFTGAMDGDYKNYIQNYFTELPEELDADSAAAERLRRDFTFEGDLGGVITQIREKLWSLAAYTLTPGKIPADQPFLSYFLYDSHQGYCMHFATAGVMILRLNGYPARYVEGYVCAPGNFTGDDSGSYVCTVRDFQAHAWAEVFIDGFGWIPVEMTPGYDHTTRVTEDFHQQNTGDPATLPQNDSSGDEIPAETDGGQTDEPDSAEAESGQETHSQNSSVPAEKNSSQENAGHSHAGGGDNAGDDPVGSGTSVRRQLTLPAWAVKCLKIAGMVLGIAAVVAAGIAARIYWMTSRYRKLFVVENRQKAVRTMYGGMNRWLRAAGAGKPENATARARVAAVSRMDGVSVEMFTVFETVAWKNRFGRGKISPEEYTAARSAYTTVVREIRVSLAKPVRLWCRFILCLPE